MTGKYTGKETGNYSNNLFLFWGLFFLHFRRQIFYLWINKKIKIQLKFRMRFKVHYLNKITCMFFLHKRNKLFLKICIHLRTKFSPRNRVGFSSWNSSGYCHPRKQVSEENFKIPVLGQPKMLLYSISICAQESRTLLEKVRFKLGFRVWIYMKLNFSVFRI